MDSTVVVCAAGAVFEWLKKAFKGVLRRHARREDSAFLRWEWLRRGRRWVRASGNHPKQGGVWKDRRQPDQNPTD